MRFVWIILLAGLLRGQTVPPVFDVAEVKVHLPDGQGGSGELKHGQIRLINLPLRFIISLAWDVPMDAVTGPAKIDGVNLDIMAKAATDKVSDTELRSMLRELLARRMKTVMRVEKRDQSVYALRVMPGGPKLEKADAPKVAEDENCDAVNGATPGHRKIHCTHASMREFLSDLPEIAPRYVDKRLVDETGLAGHWDFTLEWATAQEIESGNGGLTLFAAIQAQLGMKLESARAAVSVIVVDSSERAPVGE